MHIRHSGDTMFDKKDTKDLPALDIFKKLFQITFDCVWDGDNIDTVTRRKSRDIEQKHISLLLAWPGILAMELASHTRNKEYIIQLDKLRKLLAAEVDYPEVRDFLDKMIPKKTIPPDLLDEANKARKSGDNNRLKDIKYQLRDFHPRIYETIAFLINPKFIPKTDNIKTGLLTIAIGHYFILCCMIARLIEKKDNVAYITQGDIINVLGECEISDQLDIYQISKIQMDALIASANKELISFNHNNFLSYLKNLGYKENIALVTKSVHVPSVQLFLHRMGKKAGTTYALVERYDNPANILAKSMDFSGVAITFDPLSQFKYDLWQIVLKEESVKKKSLSKSFMFLDPEGIGEDTFSNLLIRMCQTGEQSSLIMKSIINSWDELIDNPKKITESNKYEDLPSFLKQDYNRREAFFDFKPLFNSVLSLDKDADLENFDKTRKELISLFKKHISQELGEKLRATKEEIDDILDAVLRIAKSDRIPIHRISKTRIKTEQQPHTQKQLLKIATTYWESKKFEHLIKDDLKWLVYTKDPNKRRKGRGDVLQKVSERKPYCKNIPASTIIRYLGYSR